jgi:hypothetical protein
MRAIYLSIAIAAVSAAVGARASAQQQAPADLATLSRTRWSSKCSGFGRSSCSPRSR